MQNKKTIICIVAESGAGKTFVADYLSAKYEAHLIESRTTRPKRHEGEQGHLWVTEQEFDTYNPDDMIAYTKFGDYRYCCLINDVTEPISTYVIDEFGLKYLKKFFSDTFNIFAVRIIADESKRHKRVDRQRTLRDRGKFTMGLDEFDFHIFNDYDSIKTYKQVDKIFNLITSYGIPNSNSRVCSCANGADSQQCTNSQGYKE